MAWNLQIAGPAQKEYQKFPTNDQRRVKAALLSMQEDPFQGDIQRLIETVSQPVGAAPRLVSVFT